MNLSRRQTLLVIAIVLLPAWLAFAGTAQRIWATATVNFLLGDPLYVLGGVVRSNPNTTRYVYLPTLAMVNAALWGLPFAAWTALGGDAYVFRNTIGLYLTGVIGYSGLLATVHFAARNVRERWAVPVMVALAVYPTALYHATFRGGDLWVAALFLATAYFIRERDWLLAGVAISLATFKFIGIPAAGVVLVFVLVAYGVRAGALAGAGAAIGQVPNLAYFVGHVDDLLFIIRQRGALSTESYTLNFGDVWTLPRVYTLPIRLAGVEEWYMHGWGFALVVLGFMGLAFLAMRRWGPLVGMAVAYFPMGYLIPAEQNALPFAIVLVVLLARRWPDRWAVAGVASILVLEAYHLLAAADVARATVAPFIDGIRVAAVLLHAVLFLAVIWAER